MPDDDSTVPGETYNQPKGEAPYPDGHDSQGEDDAESELELMGDDKLVGKFVYLVLQEVNSYPIYRPL